MAYILDGGVILILALAIWSAMRRGLVRSIIVMAGCVIAIILAGALSRPAASTIFDTFMRDRFVTAAETRLESNTNLKGTSQKAAAILDELPDPIANLCRIQSANDSETVEAAIKNQAGGTAHQLAVTAVDNAVKPISVSLLSTVCFAVIFFLLMILVHILASVVSRVFRLPVLKQFNEMGGALIGVIQGVLVIILYVAVLQVIATSGGSDAAISTGAIDNTILVSRIVSYLKNTAIFGNAFEVLSKVMK